MVNMKYWKLSNPYNGQAALTSVSIANLEDLWDALRELKGTDDLYLSDEEQVFTEPIQIQVTLNEDSIYSLEEGQGEE
jgi:hypothetical protein